MKMTLVFLALLTAAYVSPDCQGAVAEIELVKSPERIDALAVGNISFSKHCYSFCSGGHGNGYLPPGFYVVSGGELTTQAGMMVERGKSSAFGYKFILSDAYDNRTGKTRTCLRIHPAERKDGSTAGCIGVRGCAEVQRHFYLDLKQAIKDGGGRMILEVKSASPK